MKDTLQEIIGWAFPLITVVLIAIGASRRSYLGKPWLIAFLGIQLLTNLGWRIPRLLAKIDSIDFDLSRFYAVYALPLSIFGLAGFCLMFPMVFAVSSQSPDSHQ